MKLRANLVLAIAVGLIGVLVAVAAVVASSRGPAELDPATPEGVVQAYLRAVAESDFAAASELLAADSTCDTAAFDRADVPESLQAELVDVSIVDDRAVVEVLITEGSGLELFEPGGYSHDELFALVNEDGAWRIDRSPWPMYHCELWFR